MGSCLKRTRTRLMHSKRLNSFRADNVHKQILDVLDPITFHGYERERSGSQDPVKIYEEWFKSGDKWLVQYKNARLREQQQVRRRDEL